MAPPQTASTGPLWGVGGLPKVAATRTAPPAVARLAVQRRRLLDILGRAASRRLILIKAPAGYGKSSLAASWCKQLQIDGAIVAWLSLDADDNEPGTFAYHLARTCEVASAELGAEALGLLQASNLIPPRNVISALVNAATEIDSDIYVFFDDYHVVTERDCHELMQFLLRYAPSNLHFVVLTRAEPSLPLSRLRLEDEIAELDASLLHFDIDEAKLLLGPELCRNLHQAGVASLYASTEGWPAALQLARISLRNSPDPAAHVRQLSGTTHNISEYLEDTLQSLPAGTVDFVLKASILDQLSAAICNVVTGCGHSARMLAELERQQFLVVPLDENGATYRFHHLMRDYLLSKLQAAMPEQVAELHRRAYAWFAGKEAWAEAVHHAIAARDFDRALEFVERCAMSLVVKGDLLTLLSWERQLPEELMRGQHDVKLALAWGMALVTRFKEAEDLLAQVEKTAEASSGSELWWRCRAARAVLLALQDNSARARDLAAECLESHAFDRFNFNALCNVVRYDHLRAGDWAAFRAVEKPKPATGDQSDVLPENYHLCLCGIAAAQQLQCDEALKFYDEARLLAEKFVGKKSVSATMVTGLSARVRYERGDITGAEIAVLDSLDLIENTAFHEGFLQAFLVLIRAAAARGDTGRAIGLLNRAERLSWERGWHRIVAQLLVERMRLLLAAGNLQEAQGLLQAFQHLKTRHSPTRMCSNGEIDLHYAVAQGLVANATDHVADAAELFRIAYEGHVSAQNRLAALRIGVDLALAQLRLDEDGPDLAVLDELFGHAARANLTTFLNERKDDIARLIGHVRSKGIGFTDPRTRAFVESLTPMSSDPPSLDRGLGDPRSAQVLTERERTILTLIAAGHSNKEIARELGVGPETIKTHVKRIFQKLSAETRAQAVIRAQSLGMLESAAKSARVHPSIVKHAVHML